MRLNHPNHIIVPARHLAPLVPVGHMFVYDGYWSRKYIVSRLTAGDGFNWDIADPLSVSFRPLPEPTPAKPARGTVAGLSSARHPIHPTLSRRPAGSYEDRAEQLDLGKAHAEVMHQQRVEQIAQFERIAQFGKAERVQVSRWSRSVRRSAEGKA